jgi:hypothetical protein
MKNPAAVALGRLGGKATSEAKTRAVRENAKLGGWPKGRKRKKPRKARTQNRHMTTTQTASEKQSNGPKFSNDAGRVSVKVTDI